MLATERKILSITEITRKIRIYLEETFPQVWIQGEISNCKQHTSGHLYFTLKDEAAQISAVMWQSNLGSLLFQPEDGMKVIARGAITVYPPKGIYQIDVDKMQPVGIGELQLAFEKLKQKLAAEGLFDPRHRKPMPLFPESIGIITSDSGAALHDITSILERRFPSIVVVVLPVRVQGPGAAEEIAQAIGDMNRFGRLDVIIVGRGGGSLEDLWAFNEEIVARAIHASRIPVVSAVGHEIDFSISDFAADLRAPTPSAAAELVVRDRAELLETLRNICYTMQETLRNRVSGYKDRVKSLVESYSFNKPKNYLREFVQTLDELDRSLQLKFHHFVELTFQKHLNFSQRLESVNPRGILKRGYTLVRHHGTVVTSSKKLELGERAVIEFHDGEVPARVER